MSEVHPATFGTISPSFANPPLVEVALAVEFAPLADFGAVAMAELAVRWRDRYPRVQEHPPLPPNTALGLPSPSAGMFVSVGAPQIRLWLLTDDEARVVQLQRDRLVVNWRSGASAEGAYPRYHESLRPEFENDFEELCAFLEGRAIPAPRPINTEVAYVNSISRTSELDLVGVLRSQTAVTHHMGKPTDTKLLQTWTRVEDRTVRSTLSLEVESSAEQDVTMTLVGRNAVTDAAALSDVLGSLDRCHDDVVTSFVELTDERRHTDWGRIS